MAKMGKFLSSDKANRAHRAKSQGTNETVIFGKLEVSNEDFTICPYNPLFFPNVQCLGGMFSQSPVVLWSPVTQFLPDQLDYTRTSHLAAGKHK